MTFVSKFQKVKSRGFMWNKIKQRLIWACDSTNFHGFKIVGNKEVSIITRLSFAFISCLSFILCSYFLVLLLHDFNQQLIVNSIVSTSFPIWKIRFPSATICNFNVVYKDNIKNLMQLVTSQGIKKELFMDFLYNLSSLVVYDDNLANVDHYKKIYDVLEQNGYDVDRTMEELAQPCKSMVRQCFWRSSEIPCSEIIQKVKTNKGYCCSFNYYGKRKSAYGIIDPYNLNGTYMGLIGSNYGLRLLLDVEEEQYVSSTKPSYGFNVLVQDGADYPDMLVTTNTLPRRTEMKVSVKAKVYATSKNVRNIDVQERRCLFEDEGNIKWSLRYSYKTCLSQCKANAIFKLCGCVPFYYSIDDNRRLCNLFDEKCLELNKSKYTTLHILDEFVTENEEEIEKKEDREEELEEGEEDNYTSCRCYPQCNERIFNVIVNEARINLTVDENISVLNVYYNGDNCIKSRKNIYYTWYRILSAVGGIFSLCLGGSIISLVECFYFVGKCILYNYDEPSANVEKPPEVSRINVKASRKLRNNFKHKKDAVSKAQIFVKAFGKK